ncbi:hypothetical protein ACR6C2_39180 [Streptomyces sp. INA 01156]
MPTPTRTSCPPRWTPADSSRRLRPARAGAGGPAGFLVAYERQGAQPAGLAVVQRIATVAALQVAMVRNERETLRREGAETLAELLQEVLDPAAARRRLARHAIEGDAALFVVRHTPDEALLHCLEDHPHLLLTRGGDRYVLGAPELADAVGGLPAVAAGMAAPSVRARP